MKRFGDLFTPPASPDRDIDPREQVLNQVLPNQSYNVRLSDGHIFWRNQHHITKG